MKTNYTIKNFAKRVVMILAVGLMAVNTWADLTIDFEGEVEDYTAWTFNNLGIYAPEITAHGGDYYGCNYDGSGAATSASITTVNKIAAPSSLSCYISKESGNTTSSTWYIEVSSNGSSWTQVSSQSATAMSKGSWNSFSADLSSYSNVYVRIRYNGSNAYRCIDDIVLAEGVACDKSVTVSAGSSSTNGSITTITGSPVATCDATASNRTVTITVSPNTGYVAPTNLTFSVTSGNAVTATKESGPTNNVYVYSFAQNDNNNTCKVDVACVGKQCTLIFNQNGGEGGQTSNLTATYGSAMPAISGIPTRDHYDFEGYYDGVGGTGNKYYNSDGSSAATWNKNTTSNTTLYAKWTEHGFKNYRTVCCTQHNINIAEMTNGSVTSSVEASCEGTNNVTLTIAPAEGYELASLTVGGSIVTGSVSNNQYTFCMPDEDVAVSATFSAKTYTITYKDKGEETFSGSHAEGYPTAHTYGTATTLKGASKSSFNFGGWYTTSDCSGEPVTTLGATAYTDNITLYALWTADNMRVATISAPSNGTVTVGYGSSEFTSGSASIEKTTTVTLTAVASTGYDFNGWTLTNTSTSEDATALLVNAASAITSFTMPDHAVTIAAAFKAQEYTISYKDKGDVDFTGTNLASLPVKHTYGTATGLVDATREHYRFDGWFTDAACTESAGSSISATAKTADFTLYAKWTPFYTVTWHVNEATTTKEFVEGTTFAAIMADSEKPAVADDAVSTNCTADKFMGWATAVITKDNATNGDVSWFNGETTLNDDQDFYAVWAKETVTQGDPVTVLYEPFTGFDKYATPTAPGSSATTLSGSSISYLCTAGGSSAGNTNIQDDSGPDNTKNLLIRHTNGSFAINNIPTNGQATATLTYKWRGAGTLVLTCSDNISLGDISESVDSKSNRTCEVIITINSGDTYSLTFTNTGSASNNLRFDVPTITCSSSDISYSNYITTCCTPLAITVSNEGKYGEYATWASNEKSICKGETATLTASVTDETKCRFSHWDISGTGATLDDENANPAILTMGTAAVTVTAVFTDLFPVSVAVNDANMGSATIDAASIAYKASGETVTLAAVPATGYQFDGWTATENITINNATTATVGATGTITANFVPKSYTITFDKNEGDADGSATATYKSTDLSSVSHATRDGFNLIGYYTETTGGILVVNPNGTLVANVEGYTDADGKWIYNDDATLYAQWINANLYRVTIAAPTNGTISVQWGENAPMTEGYADIMKNTSITISAAGASGYDLATLTVNGVPHTSGNSYELTSAITVAATFAPQTYTISYKDKDDAEYSGSNLASLPSTHTYATATALVNGEKEGYDFVGWFADAACTESAGSSIGATAKTADFTLYAKWAAKSYTLAWYKNAEDADDLSGEYTTGSTAYGAAIVAPDPTRTGYDFIGWAESTDGDVVDVPANMPASDKSYYAQWSIKHYTVTWKWKNNQTYTEGVTEANSSTVYNTTVSAPTAPADNSIIGCANKFMGWSETELGYTEGQSAPADLFTTTSPAITEDKTFWAVFAEVNEGIKSLTAGEIQGAYCGANTCANKTTSYGNWTIESAGGDWECVSIIKDAGSATYVVQINNAQYNSVRHHLESPTYPENITKISIVAECTSTTDQTLYFCNGAQSNPSTNNIGTLTITKNNSTAQEVTLSSNVKSFYIYTSGTTYIKSVAVTYGSSANYVTKCDDTKASVIYDLDGGEGGCETGLYTKEGFKTCNTEPTKDGYEFAGWNDGTSTYDANTSYELTDDVTFTAQWSPATYNITYHLNGGTGDENGTYTIETATFDLPIPTNGHKRFEGWYNNENLEGDPVSAIALGTFGDKDFYAKWTERNEITFVADGVTIGSIWRAADENLDAALGEQEGTIPTATAPESCSSKEFVGWLEAEIEENEVDEAPAGLITSNAFAVSEAKTFYAVWRTVNENTVPATYAGTGTFVQITSMDELETGTYYVLRGVKNESTKYAMKNTVSSGKMVTASVTVSDGVITDPATNIVWKLGGTTDAYTLYNQAISKYVEITGNSTGGFALKSPTDAAAHYTITYNNDHGFVFTTSAVGARKIAIYDNSEFRSYSDATNILELYKMPLTTYSAYSTSCCTKGEINGASKEGVALSGGTLTSTYNKCCAGREVVLTATVNDGYIFNSWVVKAGDNAVDGTSDTDGSGNPRFTFTMPDGNVNVSANFAIDATDYIVETNDELVIDAPTVMANLTVEAGGELNIETGGSLTVNNLTIESTSGSSAAAGTSGEVIGTNMTINGDMFLTIQLRSDAMDADASSQWYCISAPFDVAINGGFYWGDGTPMVLNTHFQLFEWDGDRRATGASGWRRTSSDMQAGVAYFIGFDNERSNQNTIKLKAKTKTITNTTSITLPTHNSSVDDKYSNWNGMGNPNFHHVAFSEDIQAFDYNVQTYNTYETGSYNFVVGTPFFVKDLTSIDIEEANNAQYRAPKREIENRYSYGVRITTEGAQGFDNQMYVRASEDASSEYEIGHDLPTLNGTSSNYGALLWTENYGGKHLAIEEAPLVNGTASYVLTLSAPANGTYSISVAAPQDNADLYLTYDGTIIWNLSESAYTVDLNKGITNGYGLVLRAKVPSVVTGVDQIDAKAGAQKVIIDEHVYILRGGQMYDVNGKMVK